MVILPRLNSRVYFTLHINNQDYKTLSYCVHELSTVIVDEIKYSYRLDCCFLCMLPEYSVSIIIFAYDAGPFHPYCYISAIINNPSSNLDWCRKHVFLNFHLLSNLARNW